MPHAALFIDAHCPAGSQPCWRQGHAWLSMRRLVMSIGRCTCPCVLQKCPPCGSTAMRRPAFTWRAACLEPLVWYHLSAGSSVQAQPQILNPGTTSRLGTAFPACRLRIRVQAADHACGRLHASSHATQGMGRAVPSQDV